MGGAEVRLCENAHVEADRFGDGASPSDFKGDKRNSLTFHDQTKQSSCQNVVGLPPLGSARSINQEQSEGMAMTDYSALQSLLTECDVLENVERGWDGAKVEAAFQRVAFDGKRLGVCSLKKRSRTM
jgi:hypothetical protein